MDDPTTPHGPNLVLIGMPGVGKSTAGILTAKALGLSFVDTDVVLQQRTGRLLTQLIDEHGIDGFLNIESKIIASLSLDHSVIATGGSAVLRPEAVENIAGGGLTIYLSASLREIHRRITDIAERGIAMPPHADLAAVHAEREPRYRQTADQIIDCTRLSLEQTVQEISRIWRSFLSR